MLDYMDLNLLQKQLRTDIVKEMADNVDVYPTFNKRIVTGDET